mgnify:CR=1 FL=1|tara:strand:- start:331 stop:567 length:237 start_codon:yes stop_codon:yes gene_type:complete
MSFIAKLFTPKMPTMPVMKMPEVAEVPNYDDEQRKIDAARDLKDTMRNRKGRSSTILTTNSGLNDSDEDEISKKTLLG